LGTFVQEMQLTKNYAGNLEGTTDADQSMLVRLEFFITHLYFNKLTIIIRGKN